MRKLTDQDRKMFAAITDEFPYCMACFWRWPNFREWALPGLERAHIRGGPSRKHDRRNLLMLCNACHGLAHGSIVRIRGLVLPMLHLEHLLWIKQDQDLPHYDIPYLNSISVRRMPEPVMPDPWFFKQRECYGQVKRSD